MSRHRIFSLAGLLASLAIGQAQAACTYPKDIRLPTGQRATESEMQAARLSVEVYLSKMEDYLACLDAETAALGAAVTPAQRDAHLARHQDTIETMERIAAGYNREVRAFKLAAARAVTPAPAPGS